MVEVRRHAPRRARPLVRSASRVAGRAARLLVVATLVVAGVSACAKESPTLEGREASERGGPGPGGTADGTVPTDVTVRTSAGDAIRRMLLLSSSDGGTITLSTSGTASTLAASSKDGDARAVWFDPAVPAGVDHSACVTWTSLGENTQGGLALRVRNDDGRTRAITVTNNVFLQARWIFNLHLWDTGDREADGEIRLRVFRQFELREAGLVRFPPAPAPGELPAPPEVVDLPWRMCARVAGHVLTFKVWPTSIDEPRWDDPRHTGAALLPDEWVYAGRPGWYAGHIGPRSPLVQIDEVTDP